MSLQRKSSCSTSTAAKIERKLGIFLQDAATTHFTSFAKRISKNTRFNAQTETRLHFSPPQWGETSKISTEAIEKESVVEKNKRRRRNQSKASVMRKEKRMNTLFLNVKNAKLFYQLSTLTIIPNSRNTSKCTKKFARAISSLSDILTDLQYLSLKSMLFI